MWLRPIGWILREQSNWIELRPSARRIAEVIGGTHFNCGDLVERPSWITWEEAMEVGPDGDTVVSPFELGRVYDTVRDVFFFPADLSGRLPEVPVGEEGDPAAHLIALLHEFEEVQERVPRSRGAA